ncbi:bifunctional ornithine acetyltransferase/N-acetylglutamate synthase [Sesbania bispinosa]|nr:bifunctional ornithine acetyltransferase/N-acetylglutamate synthase [Sesbania bispinosa]
MRQCAKKPTFARVLFFPVTETSFCSTHFCALNRPFAVEHPSHTHPNLDPSLFHVNVALRPSAVRTTTTRAVIINSQSRRCVDYCPGCRCAAAMAASLRLSPFSIIPLPLF